MTDNPTPMDIYSPSGTKVLFLKLNDSAPGHEFATEHLTEGTIYTVASTEVHRFSSYVTLKEFPGLSFNTVLFFEVGEPSESKEVQVHRGYCYQSEYSDSCKYGEVDCPVKLGNTKVYFTGFNSYTCPTCGWKCKSQYEGLAVSLHNTKGIYCMECYGKWIDANIPKMIEDNQCTGIKHIPMGATDG